MLFSCLLFVDVAHTNYTTRKAFLPPFFPHKTAGENESEYEKAREKNFFPGLYSPFESQQARIQRQEKLDNLMFFLLSEREHKSSWKNFPSASPSANSRERNLIICVSVKNFQIFVGS